MSKSKKKTKKNTVGKKTASHTENRRTTGSLTNQARASGEKEQREKRGPGFWFAIFAILTVIAVVYSGSTKLMIPVTVFVVVTTAVFEWNISRYHTARATVISGLELIILGLVGLLLLTSGGTPEDGTILQTILFVFEFWFLFGIAEAAVGGLLYLLQKRK